MTDSDSSFAINAVVTAVVTFAGVFLAQYLANVVQERREAQTKRDRAEKLRAQMSNDIAFALTVVCRVRVILEQMKVSPEIRVSAGTLETHRFDAVEVCLGNPDRVSGFMIAAERIRLLNNRLDLIERLDLGEIPLATQPREHARQRADAIKKSHELQGSLESLLAFLDPERAAEWAEQRDRESRQPAS